ncbi:family 16 glycosylhydrolase [Microbacterium sp. NPDC055599]
MSHAEAVGGLLDGYVAAQVADAIVPLRARIVELEADVAALDGALDSAGSRVGELEAERARLLARIAELETPADPAVLPFWGSPVWRDEFDGDLAKWNVRTRSDLGLTIDAAVPTASAVSVTDGTLHMRGDWLPTTSTRTASATGVTTLTHSTGYLDTQSLRAGNKFYAQRYGRWEIRCQTPTGPNTRGALPAFWLRNSQTGEIDILEAWGYGGVMAADHTKYLKDTAATTIHTKTDGTGRKRIWRHRDGGSKVVPWDGLHTYVFELTPDYASMTVDGVQVMRETPVSYPDLWNPDYFGSPLHMRLNLHVGPDPRYWGLPDPANRTLTQPLDFQVDYVRVYALPQ